MGLEDGLFPRRNFQIAALEKAAGAQRQLDSGTATTRTQH